MPRFSHGDTLPCEVDRLMSNICYATAFRTDDRELNRNGRIRCALRDNEGIGVRNVVAVAVSKVVINLALEFVASRIPTAG